MKQKYTTFEEYVEALGEGLRQPAVCEKLQLDHLDDELGNPATLRSLADQIEAIVASGSYDSVMFDCDDSGYQWYGVRPPTQEEFDERCKSSWDYYRESFNYEKKWGLPKNLFLRPQKP